MSVSIPIVVICGQVPTAAVGTDAFQEAPISSIMGAAAKHVFLVTDPTKLEATVRSAFEIARTGRPGPVVVDVPRSEEHTSELQSLMRSSYAVLSLQKTKQNRVHTSLI